MADNRKQILDKFQKRLCENYRNYSLLYSETETENIEDFITYMIDHELIDANTIRRYTVINEYERIQSEGEKKSRSISIVAKRFNLSERTIYSLLRKSRRKI